MAQSVLVTGADGFIGSHLAEALVRKGYETRAFVLYNSFGSRGWLEDSPRELRNAMEIRAGDIRDPNVIRAAVKGCDFVLHLAALIAIPYSYVAPDAYVDTNIKGTLNVLQAARDFGVPVVHTSTSEVYGTARFVPITEEHPLQGQSPYSATKIAADQLALSFFRSFELPVVVLRPFNTYGPRQSARAIIPTVIVQLASGMRKIHLGSIHPTRDFSFVTDTVEGFISAMHCKMGIGKEINIGSSFEISVGDTARLIAEIMNVDLEIEQDSERMRPAASEVERLWADIGRARDLLGWSPSFGGREGFRRGLEKTITWFSDPANLARYRPEEYML
ncbi:MAG: NAD-dependent 4,6-dehydratase LegB [Methylovirgula sp.]